MALRSIFCLLIVDSKKVKVLFCQTGRWPPGTSEIANYKALLILFSVSKVGRPGALLTWIAGKTWMRGSRKSPNRAEFPATAPCHRGRGGSEVSSNSYILYIFPWGPSFQGCPMYWPPINTAQRSLLTPRPSSNLPWADSNIIPLSPGCSHGCWHPISGPSLLLPIKIYLFCFSSSSGSSQC